MTLDVEGDEFFKRLLTQLADDRRKNPKIPPDFMQLMINVEQETDPDGTQATEKELPTVGKRISKISL